MNNTNPYAMNETMEFLSYQCPLAIITENIDQQIDEILAARKSQNSVMSIIDGFMLGYIYGKRAERARRKGGAIA